MNCGKEACFGGPNPPWAQSGSVAVAIAGGIVTTLLVSSIHPYPGEHPPRRKRTQCAPARDPSDAAQNAGARATRRRPHLEAERRAPVWQLRKRSELAKLEGQLLQAGTQAVQERRVNGHQTPVHPS